VHPLFLYEAVEFARSHYAFLRSKALEHGHCRGKTSSISADRGDDGIWIYVLAGSFIIFICQIASGHGISVKQNFFIDKHKQIASSRISNSTGRQRLQFLAGTPNPVIVPAADRYIHLKSLLISALDSSLEPCASGRIIQKRWPDTSGTNTEFMVAGSSACSATLRIASRTHAGVRLRHMVDSMAHADTRRIYLRTVKLNQINTIPTVTQPSRSSINGDTARFKFREEKVSC
jgi:hypothetical protein